MVTRLEGKGASDGDALPLGGGEAGGRESVAVVVDHDGERGKRIAADIAARGHDHDVAAFAGDFHGQAEGRILAAVDDDLTKVALVIVDQIGRLERLGRTGLRDFGWRKLGVDEVTAIAGEQCGGIGIDDDNVDGIAGDFVAGFVLAESDEVVGAGMKVLGIDSERVLEMRARLAIGDDLRGDFLAVGETQDGLGGMLVGGEIDLLNADDEGTPDDRSRDRRDDFGTGLLNGAGGGVLDDIDIDGGSFDVDLGVALGDRAQADVADGRAGKERRRYQDVEEFLVDLE